MQSYDSLMEKWAPVLNEESAGKITDNHRRSVTAAILENQEKAMMEQFCFSRFYDRKCRFWRKQHWFSKQL